MRRYMDPYDSEEMRPGPDCDEAPPKRKPRPKRATREGEERQ